MLNTILGRSKKQAPAKPKPAIALATPKPLGVGNNGAQAVAAPTALLSTQDDLTRHLPARIEKLRDDVVGRDNASRICPATLADSDVWVVLVTPKYTNSDLLRAAISSCKQRGAKEVLTFQITPTLLLSLREGKSGGRTLRQDDNATVHKAAFDEILNWGVRNNASDVHLNLDKFDPTSQICFSIDGKYVAPARWRISSDQLESVLNVAWQSTKGGASPVFSGESEQQARLEFTVDNTHYMGRWAHMASDRGPSVCIRILNISDSVATRTLTEQGFLPTQIAMFERAQTSEGGAIVLAGVVGSGKSTTIATLLSMVPKTRKIITLEDPVEYRIPNALQNTIARDLEESEDKGFLGKLRTVKRSAPHDLLIGEIRDTTTGLAFMDVTGTGTNVYTTIHAKSAFQIPERLASESIGIPNSFLASPGILNLLVFQALIPVLCTECSLPIDSLRQTGGNDVRGQFQPAAYWNRYISRIESLFNISSEGLNIKNPHGCKTCQHPEIPELSGYRGRTVIAEMIEPNADREVLRCVMSGDTLSLQMHLEQAPRAPIDDPDMTNKTIMECAMYKSSQGLIDPRDIEVRTRSFVTEEMIRSQLKKGATP